MQQMPEEIRNLQQRACPSASYNDETPRAWQKCPGKRRLGTRRQRSVPSFSDCTIQYIIDCNLSSHSADTDTSHALPADDTCDVIGSSPPRKRPHLDVVDFFTFVYFYLLVFIILYYFGHYFCSFVLQCFDTVGWATGGTSQQFPRVCFRHRLDKNRFCIA